MSQTFHSWQGRKSFAAFSFALLIISGNPAWSGDVSQVLRESAVPPPAVVARLRLPAGTSYMGGVVRQTDNFVVWARTHPRDANWAARELQRAWTDTTALFDQWSTSHRLRGQRQGPVPVVIDNRPQRQRQFAATPFAVENGLPMVYINAAVNQPPITSQLSSVRAAAAQSFLYLNDLDRRLPDWAEEGMVDYIRHGPRNDEKPASGRSLHADRMHGGRFEFLLEGADSRYAPNLFTSLSTITQSPTRYQPVPRLSQTHLDRQKLTRSQSVSAPPSRSLDQLWSRAEIQSHYAAWKLDPLDQMPMWDPDKGLSNKLERRQREMVLLLKLMWRFQWPSETDISRRTTPSSIASKSVTVESGTYEPTFDLRDFHEFLTDRDTPRWATRDIDGSLLLSEDRHRIDALFALGKRRYHVVKRDGLIVLLNHWYADVDLVAWLENNSQNSGRPIAEVRQARSESQRRSLD